uniref:Protein AE7-like 1 n=1 Tax=Nelumbo nucifera TaxID=4432 RepID=A0A822Z848_NELNU|nr:TPA_asm: hypothetical protein HUJ06_015046 [Nelumbo nucifera]
MARFYRKKWYVVPTFLLQKKMVDIVIILTLAVWLFSFRFPSFPSLHSLKLFWSFGLGFNYMLYFHCEVLSFLMICRITFTPTIQHCSMATIIGLCLRVKLMNYFPSHFKVDIKVAPGSHANEESVNKQLNDKERVAAALENPNLRQLVDECIYSNEL